MDVRPIGRRWAQGTMAVRPLRELLGSLSRHGLLPTLVQRHLPLNRATTFRIRVGRSTFRYGFVPGDQPGTALFWHGWCGYEPETVRVYRLLLEVADWVFDIGAHTGVYSLLACALNPRVMVTAFEPVPETAERLRSNVVLNAWDDRCEVRVCAVSDRIGRAAFHVPTGVCPDMASLGTSGWRGLPGKVTEVSTTTIDSVADSKHGVGLIKVDVEGHEDEVLVGAAGTIERCRPILIVECNPEGPYRAVERILRDHRYALFHLRGIGPIPVERISPDPRGITGARARNFLGWPEERNMEAMGL